MNFMVIFEWTLMLVFDLNCDEWMDRWQPECLYCTLLKQVHHKREVYLLGLIQYAINWRCCGQWFERLSYDDAGSHQKVLSSNLGCQPSSKWALFESGKATKRE